MKQGNRGYSPEDEHTEQPDLTLKNLDCIPSFSNNISSLLGTTIRNNDSNLNIAGSVNYFVPQSQSQVYRMYYQYYMPDNQSYIVPGQHLYCFSLCMFSLSHLLINYFLFFYVKFNVGSLKMHPWQQTVAKSTPCSSKQN